VKGCLFDLGQRRNSREAYGGVETPLAQEIRMKDSSETDIQALHSELAQLRADVSRLVDTVKSLSRHTGDRVAEAACDSTEELRAALQSKFSAVAQEIEDKPLTSALTAFLGGLLIGALFKRAR
jgi:ElaB/YqjD/DUF883 family membrane-anchored ribosome-binding protein